MLQAQVRVNTVVHYEEDSDQPTAKVKVFKDNKLYEELRTNKRGKFRMMLQLGHDFLFEVSKDFHFTTRFVVSTKLPEEKMEEDVYASFDIETDLIKNFQGLDGSIMDKPIMILRYIPEEDVFDFDKSHLRLVQSRVNRLVDESERLERKGAKALAKPIPKNARKAEAKQPEIEPPPEITEEEKMISSTTHDADDLPEETESASTEEEEKPSTNESYEMRMRRERLQREKEKRANLALKRGYESSLIRQVAEENRQLSKAEIQQRTIEKEDSSLIQKAQMEKQLKEFKNQQREDRAAKKIEATENKQLKAKMETGMIREVATSDRNLRSAEVGKEEEQLSKEGKSTKLEPKIRESSSEDDFGVIEELYLDYPSYTLQFSKETYDFGMVNYYIDKQAVEKEEFCKKLAAFEAYKINLKCE